MDNNQQKTNLAKVGEALKAVEQQDSRPDSDIQPGQIIGTDGETITLNEKF